MPEWDEMSVTHLSYVDVWYCNANSPMKRSWEAPGHFQEIPSESDPEIVWSEYAEPGIADCARDHNKIRAIPEVLCSSKPPWHELWSLAIWKCISNPNGEKQALSSSCRTTIPFTSLRCSWTLQGPQKVREAYSRNSTWIRGEIDRRWQKWWKASSTHSKSSSLLPSRGCSSTKKKSQIPPSSLSPLLHYTWRRLDFVGRTVQRETSCIFEAVGERFVVGDWSFQGQRRSSTSSEPSIRYRYFDQSWCHRRQGMFVAMLTMVSPSKLHRLDWRQVGWYLFHKDYSESRTHGGRGVLRRWPTQGQGTPSCIKNCWPKDDRQRSPLNYQENRQSL